MFILRSNSELYVIDVRSLLKCMAAVSETPQTDTDKPEKHLYPLKRTRVGMNVFHLLMKAVCLLYRFKTYGLENIASNEQYIICPNHVSNMDGIFVYSGIAKLIDCNSICCFAKKELFDSFFTRAFMRWCGAIPVDRSGNTATAYKAAVRCLEQQGMSALIFPKGRRSPNGELGSMKNGAAQLAKDTVVKLLPVYIEGTYKILPSGCKFPHLFDNKNHKRLPVSVIFCPPIEPGELTAQEITEMVRERLLSGSHTLSGISKAQLYLQSISRLVRGGSG